MKKKEIIASNTIIDATQVSNEIQIGKITIGQMIFYSDSVWLQIEDEEGGQFPKKHLEELLIEYFNKHF